jgi:Starch-binding associating with outer membrane
MQQVKKHILIAALGSMLIFSCTKTIQDLETNPNNPTSVPPALILGGVLTDLSGTATGASAGGSTAGTTIGNLGGIASWDAVSRWNQYYCANYNYYNVNNYTWQSGPFDGYLVLQNVVQMEKEAISRGAAVVNPYAAIGRFVRAWYYYNMTSMMGDIPVGDALLGSLNPNPPYTPQKQVFQYILNTLDTANTQFASLIAAGDVSLSTTQDIYYNGNLVKWQQLVNSFKLRVLISLSLQSSDADLNVPAQFANIFNNPVKYPVFQSQADDLAFVYQPSYNLYYFNESNYNSIATRYNMAYTYIQAMDSLNDPRVFVTSEPAWKLVDSLGYAPTDFRAFNGSSTGESITKMVTEASAGLYSFINRKRYFAGFTGEPDVLVGYKEMCFNIAEAMNRGWITGGNAETWYMNGITQSFQFYGIDPTQTSFTAYFQQPTQTAYGDYTAYPVTYSFPTYYNQAAVKYTPGAPGLSQIALQKYIAMFVNSGWEGYFNWRRTGVPTFQNGIGIGNNNVVPLRWSYPVSEQSINRTNWLAALSNQQFATDDLNETLWLLK